MVGLIGLGLVKGLVIVRGFSCCFVSCFIISSWGLWGCDCVTFLCYIFLIINKEGNDN